MSRISSGMFSSSLSDPLRTAIVISFPFFSVALLERTGVPLSLASAAPMALAFFRVLTMVCGDEELKEVERTCYVRVVGEM